MFVRECVEGEERGGYVDLSVHVVPVMAFGFTDAVAGAGFRFTRVGTAIAVAAKMEMRIVSCILGVGSTVE